MNISQIPQDDQRTKDWRIARLGKFTGSKIADLMTTGRKKDEPFGTTAKSYLYDLASERDLSFDTISSETIWDRYLDLTTAYSKAMQFGTDNEDDAIHAFDLWLHSQETINIAMDFGAGNDIDVAQVPTDTLAVLRGGSVPHPTIANFSASPDAVIYCKGTGLIVAVLETKVPLPKTFTQYRAEVRDADTLKAVNPTYYYQVHAEMMVTECHTAFFCAYQPFLVHNLHVAQVALDPITATAITERIALAEQFISNI